MAQYLGVVKLGGFYQNGKALLRPVKPWRNDMIPDGTFSRGDIPSMSGSMADYSFGDTPAKEADQLCWVKIADGNRTLLICDRNILVNCSWDDLNSQGYVTGKKVIVDGAAYNCRLLTGGSSYRSEMDYYDWHRYWGMPRDNEWDRFITCEDNIAGLPVPTASDMETRYNTPAYNSNHLNGAHNRLWNWYCCSSWCQEIYTGNPGGRAVRGSPSVHIWKSIASSMRISSIGFRPVLEVLDPASQPTE